jgi:hypothetical protein
MKYNLYRKTWIFGIIIIFILAGIAVPNLSGNIKRLADFESAKTSTRSISEMNPNIEYSHTVFVEVATSQNCEPCHSWNQNIYNAYTSGDYDFEYVEMIEFDHAGLVLNEKAHNWANNYSISAYPTSILDGDYQRIVGNHPDQLPGALKACGIRSVVDISADITVSWFGNATIYVSITIQNNEGTQYNGHIRACITEIISRYDTYYGDNYHFGFLDYVFHKEISIDPWGIYTDSTIWNGNEHADNHGNDFGDIAPDNIKIIMGVFNDNNDYVDETVMAQIIPNNPPNIPSDPDPWNGATDIAIDTDLSWTGGDPDGGLVTYDVYFDTNNPPLPVVWNQSGTVYDPGILALNTTYYWKIIPWDNHGASVEGPIWQFTTSSEPMIKTNITRPMERSFYFENARLFSLPRNTIVVGFIDIIIDAVASEGLERVEFYINGRLRHIVTEEPYEYRWRTWLPLWKHTIDVVAYDINDNTASDEITVWKLF